MRLAVILGFILGMFFGGLLCISGNTKAADWATTDKVLLGTYAALSFVDAVQTSQGLKSGKFVETNPIMGEHPSDARLALTKIVLGTGIYWLADRFPDARRTILVIANSMQIAVVGHNQSIGMRVNW